MSTLMLGVGGGRRPEGLVGPVVRLRGAAVVGTAAVAAVGLGSLTGLAPGIGLVLVTAVALCVLVWRRPEYAAYTIVLATPLIVGIDRDRLVPLVRPNEALLGLLTGILLVQAAVRLKLGATPRLRIDKVTASILAMAVSSSVLPITFLVLRGRPVEMDDITHAAVLWKLLTLYLLVRWTVRTERQVRTCLFLSLAAATVVGFLGICQSLDLLGVRGMLAPWFGAFGEEAAVHATRAGSTIGLPPAAGDFMVFNLALVAAIWWKEPRLRWLLAPVGVVCTVAVFSAAEFASAIGLAVGTLTVALVLRRPAILRYAALGLPLALIPLWPSLEHRIEEFGNMHGMPHSWIVRLYNLETYFWPELLSGSNLLLGVRPSARVPVEGMFGFVWIESGHTWLLWGGGVFLFAAFVWFVWAGLSTLWPLTRPVDSWRAVAAVGGYVALVVVTVLMLFDPHITYRGAADALFGLLALALVSQQKSPAPATPDAAPGRRGGTDAPQS